MIKVHHTSTTNANMISERLILENNLLKLMKQTANESIITARSALISKLKPLTAGKKFGEREPSNKVNLPSISGQYFHLLNCKN